MRAQPVVSPVMRAAKPYAESNNMKKRILIICLIVFVSLAAIGALTGAAVVFWVSRDLPSITQVSDYRPPQVTTVYARDGSIIGYFYDERRFMVNLSEMPKHLPAAFLAMEDDSFYEHDGVNPKAILRAFIKNAMSGTNREGGSTITQQVVKRLLLTPEKSYTRKIKEAILAYRLEKYLSKDDILNIYLNQIFFGNGAHGVEAAARTYFGKHVGDLTLAESAVLASLPKAPSTLNPYANLEGTQSRQRLVLGRMLETNRITKEEYDEAMAQPLVYANMPDPSWKLGGWYLEEVRRELESFLSEANVRDLNIPLERYGRDALYNAGLHIYTAMDPVHQKAAEMSVMQGLWEVSRRHGWQGPVKTLEADKIESEIKKSSFTPQSLDNAGWAQAVVTKVSAKSAEVRLGAYKGVIDASSMTWCREPNPALSPDAPGQVRKPDKVLNVGDVVWVSAVGASGDENPVAAPAGNKVPAYDSSKVTAEVPIQLSLEQVPLVQGALVSMETETGDVVAMVGGYKFSAVHNQFNRADRAKRQPGSSFKPVVYSAAIDAGFTAASMIEDAPYVAERGTDNPNDLWRPSNFDGVFYGPILLRTALAKSRNLCTIRLAHKIGVPAIIDRAHLLGIEGNIPRDLSISLGSHAVTPLKMTEAYSSFANGGKRSKPRTVLRVTDTWGMPVVTFVPEITETVSEQNAYIMASLMKDVVTSGTGRRAAVLDRAVAGKTGTTNEERDAWFIGFTPQLVSTVYVGYDDNRPMGRPEGGARTSIPIFVGYRKVIEKTYPEKDFAVPDGVKVVGVDADNGLLSGLYTEHVVYLPFVEGTEPRAVSGAPLERGANDVEVAVDIFKQ